MTAAEDLKTFIRDVPAARGLTGFGLPGAGAPSLPTEGVRQMLGFVPSYLLTCAQAAALLRRQNRQGGRGRSCRRSGWKDPARLEARRASACTRSRVR